MPRISPTRKILKMVGILTAILGVSGTIWSFMQSTSSFTIVIPGAAPEQSTVYGETNFFRIAGIFFGSVLIYIGYRAFKYIPKSEREKELVDDV